MSKRKPIGYDLDNARPYRVISSGVRRPSSAYSVIECPWCGTRVIAYHWSIAGGGKKCPSCGAKHNSFGTTAKLIENPVENAKG